MRGGYFTFKTDYILPFPVPEIIPSNIHETIVKTVDVILEMKVKDKKNDTFEFEKVIDKCIYSLYKLTEEEVVTIENHDIN